jgi:hypothetical protein
VEVAVFASSSDPAAGSDRRGRARQRVNVAAARLDDRCQRVAGDGVAQEGEAVLRPDRVPGRGDGLPREKEPRDQRDERRS